MALIHFAAKIKARQARGGSWVQFFLNIGIITANVALFQDVYAAYGISLSTMLIVSVVGYLVGTVVIGYFDERYGVWQHENKYNSNLNPAWVGVQSKVEEMHAIVTGEKK